MKSCKEQENIEATPRTKVKRLLKGQAVSEVVRKRLVFGELIEQELSKSYGSTANIRDKHLIRNIFTPDKLHKYKVKRAVERLVGINKAKCNTDYKALHLNIATDVKTFLEKDEFSRLCPGKKDTITMKKDMRQKRFLNKTLKDIHEEILEQTKYKISYSLFLSITTILDLGP